MKKTTLYLIVSLILNLVLSQTVGAQSNSPYVTASYLGNGRTVVTFAPPTNGVFNCSYLLASNQVVTLNTFYCVIYITTILSFADGSSFNLENFATTSTKASELQFTGLASINYVGNRTLNPAGFITFTIDTPSTNSACVTPVNSVVIPSDATGPVQIILESSSDLVNWIPSLPGTYGSTYTNRFFRVRAVAQ